LEPFLFLSLTDRKAGKAMKKMIILGSLIVFIPVMVFAQEKVEAPGWNVGDKWVFTQGNIEVIGADKNSYALNFSKDTCIIENVGFETIIFEKSTLNRIYFLKEDKREKYTQDRRRILNFPFNPGKQWQDNFSTKELTGVYAGRYVLNFSESFTVLGWQDVEVQAGKFRAIRLGYTIKQTTAGTVGYGREGWVRYWYSPGARYFVKCQYDKIFYPGEKDWELTSYELRK
jgi:hypothetical protein